MCSFQVMSFNIDGYRADCAAARHWDKRATVALDILRRYDADLIGFQEVQTPNRATLDTYLTSYASEYGIKNGDEPKVSCNYNPIYWKKDRFEKLDAGAFYLSTTPGKWSKSWDAMNVRSLTWVRLRCRQTGLSFIHANTHLDHRGSQARVKSSKLIVRKLMQLRQAENLAVLITGDFNARAWSPPGENVHDYPEPVLPSYLPAGGTVHRIYLEQGFQDVYLEAGYRNQLDMNTYHDYYGVNFPPVALRIDWILFLHGEHQIEVQEYLLIRDACPPVFASDHYPIMGRLVWHHKYASEG